MKKIKITIGNLIMEADLNDTPTAIKIADILPFKSAFNTWGEEIYFTVPVESGLDSSAREVVEAGDLGYWPTGQAFCIFFGQTPMSSPGKIVPASAVNIIGKVLGNPDDFNSVMGEREILLETVITRPLESLNP
ncbi:cyclophilin-like fold protein [Thermodesulfobacteriota bacterium]